MPEKSTYDGGAWHIEGQLVPELYGILIREILNGVTQNEHIVSTAIYYYSNENITSSQLAFRQFVDKADFENNFPYEQGNFEFLEKVFSCADDKSNMQFVGHFNSLTQ